MSAGVSCIGVFRQVFGDLEPRHAGGVVVVLDVARSVGVAVEGGGPLVGGFFEESGLQVQDEEVVVTECVVRGQGAGHVHDGVSPVDGFIGHGLAANDYEGIGKAVGATGADGGRGAEEARER